MGQRGVAWLGFKKARLRLRCNVTIWPQSLLELELHDTRHRERPEPRFTPNSREARRAQAVQLSLNPQHVCTERPIARTHDEPVTAMAIISGDLDMVPDCRPVFAKVAKQNAWSIAGALDYEGRGGEVCAGTRGRRTTGRLESDAT